ncbi:MAG: hypothetical protein WBI05_10430 [Rhodoferax sp.]|uniref:hypothetical protein n=1 Tax=Rhodoferax sp. TaxID=50421 RepID=UPI003BB791C6
MKTTGTLAGVLLFNLALVACTTTGTGGGQLAGGGTQAAPVAFSWTSKDGGLSGTMTAVLPDVSYQGEFFQITRQTRTEVLAPLWVHWNHGWYDWPYWGGPASPPYPVTQFITHYSGKVVATLAAPGEQRMRCRFHLMVPARGMSGGGEGQCQLSDGRLVRAVFPAN